MVKLAKPLKSKHRYSKQLSRKTAKGQPVMSAMVGHYLNKIQKLVWLIKTVWTWNLLIFVNTHKFLYWIFLVIIKMSKKNTKEASQSHNDLLNLSNPLLPVNTKKMMTQQQD